MSSRLLTDIDLIDPSVPLPRSVKWSPTVQIKILAYFAVCFILLTVVPEPDLGSARTTRSSTSSASSASGATVVVQPLVRAPDLREGRLSAACATRAAALWDSGWRPRHIHVQMTTFREHREISEAVIRVARVARSAKRACRRRSGSAPASARTRTRSRATCKLVGGDLDITLRIIRQNQPGKRVAIALILRAMSRAGLGKDDIVIFMDGDFVLASRRGAQMLSAVRARSRAARPDHRRARHGARARGGCSRGSICASRSAAWPCRATPCPTAC